MGGDCCVVACSALGRWKLCSGHCLEATMSQANIGIVIPRICAANRGHRRIRIRHGCGCWCNGKRNSNEPHGRVSVTGKAEIEETADSTDLDLRACCGY
jgi:hypothetical protein